MNKCVSTLFKNSPYIQNKLIKEGTITLNNDIMPNYFKESKKDKSLKKSKEICKKIKN